MSRIIAYPIPVHERLTINKRFIVRVRPVGVEAWIDVPCWNVKVDMHDVRDASMGVFDFEGSVEIEITVPVKCYHIYKAAIRPLSRDILFTTDINRLVFTLDRPENLSIELNGDRFHNLHLFAGNIEKPVYDKGNAVIITGDFNGEELAATLDSMPKTRAAVFLPGVHEITDNDFKIPSDTTVIYQSGAVTIGSIFCDHVENIRILGRGVVYQRVADRNKEKRDFKITYSRNVTVDGLIFINPPYYTIFMGSSSNIKISNIKTFSCEGWSDGIDMMSSRDVLIEGCFLRTSDDCVAVYGQRWEFEGDVSGITVRNCVLWADVAHPINIGTHGDHEHNGNILENLIFTDIDILEHHEMQPGYLGCMAINVGDKNFARNITFENIRIEHFEHGKLFDIQVKHNPDYNPAPGSGIENVVLKNIIYNGCDAVPSVIAGFDEIRKVRNVDIINLCINGKHVTKAEEKVMEIGRYVENVNIF